ncbi:MAG: cohesin domain-containing protein [Bacteroidota bacterium]
MAFSAQAQAPVLNCPASQSITLDPGDCEFIFNFTITATDATDPNPTIVQLAGPPSGTPLQHNTTTDYQFQATDFDGNSSICSFSITVNEFPVSSGSLGCNNGTVQVSLDENCMAVVSADMILEGNSYGCYDNYTVTITDLSGNNIGNTVTGANIGQTLMVQVTDPRNGNNCWGSILVEDKLIPDLLCTQYTIPCTANLAPSLTASPGFPLPTGVTLSPDPNSGSYDPNYVGPWTVNGFDPCGPVTLTYSDVESPRACQPINNVITRTWTAVDASGNSTSCSETINLQRATLANLVTPPDYDNNDEPSLKCDEREDLQNTSSCGPSPLGWNTLPAGHPFAGNPDPADELYPGCPQVKWFGTGFPSGVECGDINYTFSDTRINTCTTGASESCYQIIRRWTIQDWCTGQVTFHNQVIKVEDEDGPVINGISDLTISTDVWRCEADWYATRPFLTDACSSGPLDYSISSSAGTVEQLSADQFIIRDLPLGTHMVTYTASDCCGSTTVETIELTVIDDVPPAAVCDAQTVVSLTTTGGIDASNIGLTKIFASTFDDGSHDNCSNEVWFKAIRMDEFNSNGNNKNGETVREGDWSSIDCDGANGDDDLRVFPPWYQGNQSYFDDYVKFCCADINDGPIMVVFRVFDVDPTPFTFGQVFPNLVPPGEDPADYAGVLPEEMMPGGALYGRFNDCMVEVTVQDKQAPRVFPPADITVTCDFWFPFDPDNPNDFTTELDDVFGEVVPNVPNAVDRDSIIIRDRVCPAHPRFSEFAPPNIFDDPCYDDQYDIYWGKDGYSLSNCDQMIDQQIISNLTCGKGTIIRRWRSSDGSGNWSNLATQTITIIDCKEFYVPTACWRFTPKDVGECDLVNIPGQGLQNRIKLIEWPCDVEVTTCQGPGTETFLPENLAVQFEEDRRPRFDDDNCSMIAATFEDEPFIFIDSSCVKIFRNWRVVDWCLFEEFQNGTYTGEWQWDWQQVIKLVNNNGPDFADCTDKTFCGFGDPNSSITDPLDPNYIAAQCVGIIELRPEISDDCSMLEDLRIDFKLDAFNDGQYDILGYSDNYGNVYPFPNPNFLPVRTFAAEDANADGTYPVGTHRILWGAEDGCGNTSVCEYLFTIEDCKPPTAYCEVGISTIPMPDTAGGFVDIWASDFDLGSFDNCTEQADLVFAFSTDPNDRSIRLTCADAGQNLSFTVFVFDEAGNYSSCLVGVVLNNCDGQTVSVTGEIRNEEGIGIANVNVGLEGFMTGSQMTNSGGSFNFFSLQENQNYIINPDKNINPLNGVTTFDLVLISKHILGVEALNSPYKIIAADANNSGSVTTFDMVEIRKLILYIDTEFESNTSWRFVPQEYNFEDPTNPFLSTFPEVYSINGLEGMVEADFVAIKTGDVNCSASTDLVSSEDRSSENLTFQLKDKQLKAGEEYSLTFRADDFQSVLGYQFALQFDTEALEFVETNAAQLPGLNAANFGKALLDRGVLTTSWNDPEAISESGDLFEIRFRAKQDVRWSEVISLSDDYTAAEAYLAGEQDALERWGVALDFEVGQTTSMSFELLQNQPNPFREQTLVSFYLPEATQAVFSVYDVAGREVKRVVSNYDAGHHMLTVEANELPGGGVFYYQLQTATDSRTLKMLKVK